jgi:hypothetical protein
MTFWLSTDPLHHPFVWIDRQVIHSTGLLPFTLALVTALTTSKFEGILCFWGLPAASVSFFDHFLLRALTTPKFWARLALLGTACRQCSFF